MLIRFELKKIGDNQISFKILEQSHLLYLNTFEFKFGDKTFSINSVASPYISINIHNGIWIRGTHDEFDDRVVFETFRDKNERDSHYELILVLFKLLNQRFKNEN